MPSALPWRLSAHPHGRRRYGERRSKAERHRRPPLGREEARGARLPVSSRGTPPGMTSAYPSTTCEGPRPYWGRGPRRHGPAKDGRVRDHLVHELPGRHPESHRRHRFDVPETTRTLRQGRRGLLALPGRGPLHLAAEVGRLPAVAASGVSRTAPGPATDPLGLARPCPAAGVAPCS